MERKGKNYYCETAVCKMYKVKIHKRYAKFLHKRYCDLVAYRKAWLKTQFGKDGRETPCVD